MPYLTARDAPAPTPFPVRAFVAIGAAWVLLDVPIVIAISRYSGYGNLPPHYLLTAWQGFIAAKVMLLLGWWFLGEGMLRHRVAGAALLVPALLPSLFSHGDVACGLAALVLFAVPLSAWVGLAFVILRGMDYRLVRGLPAAQEKVGQFTIRQLMLLTLVASIVSALLRWAQKWEGNAEIFALVWPLLAWGYPLVMCRGVLRPHWYPEGLLAAGVTAYVLALPSFTLREDSAIHATVGIEAYTLTFTIHLLLLRHLGFRLIQIPRYLRRPNWLPPEWGRQ